MKKAILLLAISVVSTVVISQTTATNFDVNDCNGQPYNFFNDLDQGNVVVIAWVMPCFSCIQDPLEAYLIVQDYDPEKVKFFMVDDYADHDCADIQTWSENYQMGNCTKFVSSAISMSDYGVDGMPKIVVAGCNTHKVFFNKNSSHAGIKQAIDAAIEECNLTTIKETKELSSKLSVFPNPTSECVAFSFNEQSVSSSLSITNLLGVEVLNINPYFPEKAVDVSVFSKGIYLAKIESDRTIYSKPFIVNR